MNDTYSPGTLVRYLDAPVVDVGLILAVNPDDRFSLLIVWGSDLETDWYHPNQIGILG